MTLILRQSLRINGPLAANDVTAVDVWADGEGDAINVRLSIIYNDLSNQEWWKDKKEKIVGSFRVHEGESIRVPELEQFGIEPFEMRALDAKPIVLQSGDGPRITNKTRSLEVVRLERSLDRYFLWLRNISAKNVVAYYLSVGTRGLRVHGLGYGHREAPVIGVGETHREEHLEGQDIESTSLTIRVVVFEDGSYEGDAELAAGFLATREGIRIQASGMLRMIEQALEAEDAEMEQGFHKLEAQLAAIGEAIDKQSALELLKTKYPSFDEATFRDLYEDLKRGLYEAKNMALSPIGNVKREVQKRGAERTGNDIASKAKLFRETLSQISENLEVFVGRR